MCHSYVSLPQGSHYDPNCDLFVPSERNMVLTSNAFLIGMLGVLALATAKLGVGAMFNLYFMPYWINVVWLDIVTYLVRRGRGMERGFLSLGRGWGWG